MLAHEAAARWWKIVEKWRNLHMNTKLIIAALSATALLAAVPTASAEERCDLTGTVCATAGASAFAGPFCQNEATGIYYVCWTGTAGGSAWGLLGLVTGTLTGSANAYPLYDTCASPGTTLSCSVGHGYYDWAGASVTVTAVVTAFAPYGTISAEANDSYTYTG